MTLLLRAPLPVNRIKHFALTGCFFIGCLDCGCRPNPKEAPPQTPAKEPPSHSKKMGMEGLMITLEIGEPHQIRGSVRFGRVHPGRERAARMGVFSQPILIMESVAVTTSGDDLRILSQITVDLSIFGGLKSFEIRGLRVFGAQGETLLECAEAAPIQSTAWELRGVRLRGGRFLPRAKVDWSAPDGVVEPHAF